MPTPEELCVPVCDVSSGAAEATPAPTDNAAAPIPSVIAPAPSHEYGCLRRLPTEPSADERLRAMT